MTETTLSTEDPPVARPMGFWKCWAMAVGVMIGSGVFMLPAVLAPFGSISFIGWLLSSVGAIVIGLVLGRLASRTRRSGGFYIYTQKAFGNLPGFLIAWGYWFSVIFAVAAISVAFTGYLGALIPQLKSSPVIEACVAAALIWTLTAVNMKSVNAGATLQLVTTLLKLIPLAVIILLGAAAGTTENIPPFNPQNLSWTGALATTALLTMWAFLGMEGAVIAAQSVVRPRSTIPRAVTAATLTAAVVYIGSTAAVMMLVPVGTLAESTAPFVDAAARLGMFGAPFIAIGVLVSTAGSVNGSILLGGQMPMAVALDGLAPRIFARLNPGGAPIFALLLCSSLATLCLTLNYSAGLIKAFTFLISMSTLCSLLPYAVSALAELKWSLSSAKGWAIVALLALVFAIFAMAGSGLKILLWGVILLLAGLPVYYMSVKANASH